uniref:Txe/YoeB family addiction module toxin n=1 Tax=Companilactobacillus jidongensis TaxID=2486006 RepID=UPI001CDBA343
MNGKREVSFLDSAWSEYVDWQSEDKRTVKRINKLIKSIYSDAFDSGLGKPEPLKHNLSGLWSRRIDEYNRLVYYVKDEKVIIVQCKLHYDK